MCGLSGFVELRSGRNATRHSLTATARAMVDSLTHRGPDDVGTWVDPTVGIALGFRRLAIVDLTATGRQPMVSASGRYVIAFNGEIYNHSQLRQRLQSDSATPANPAEAVTDGPDRDVALGYAFRGRSDTEVLLAAIETWGLEKALIECVGMFAICVWDCHTRQLHLARDRMGEKPLYYGVSQDVFLFGSELKALWRHPQWRGVIDHNAVSHFLRFKYVPSPRTVFQGIFKLLPGTYLTLDIGKSGSLHGGLPPAKYYWNPESVVGSSLQNVVTDSPTEIVQHLEHLLRDAIKGQMLADVPVGAFLSGGIDSSAVVALMQAESSRRVRTFTIGFTEEAFNEATYAKEVARHLGTDHTELYVTPGEARAVVPQLGSLYDEPFADVSQIPTYLVSQLAKRHVTVSLSGDGGDELFCGYRRYQLSHMIWKCLGWVPSVARTSLGKLVEMIPPQVFDDCMSWLDPFFRRHGGRGSSGQQIIRLAQIAGFRNRAELYTRFVSYCDFPSDFVVSATQHPVAKVAPKLPDSRDVRTWMMFTDMLTYLPDDILVKVDRASMGVSLECRAPFLDHRIVEYSWRIPPSLKVHQRQSKWPIRQLLYKYVPRELVDRPKAGFCVPIGEWIRGPLRDWAESHLDEHRLASEGILDPSLVRQSWQQFLSGANRTEHFVWHILMFQSWYEFYQSTRSLRFAA